MRVLRWLGIALGGLVCLALVGVGVVYGMSGRLLRQRHEVTAPLFATALPTDSASIAEGERLARTRGCAGCHGPDLGGEVFFSEPGVATVVATNLTMMAQKLSDAEFERAIRHGIRPDGTTLFSMPAEMYRSLTDADLARIVAWIRSLPEVEGERSPRRLGPLGRLGLVLGEYRSSRYYIETETPLPPPADTALALGHYVAISSCTECHGGLLTGDGGSPSLPAVVALYTPEELAEFFRTGIAKGGRELPMMSGVARGRFAHFTRAETDALHGYLSTLR
jgi:mono/diheme cytochrome c family protein